MSAQLLTLKDKQLLNTIFLGNQDTVGRVVNLLEESVTGGVTSVFTRSGAVVAVSGDYTVGMVTGAAPLASPTFTGVPAAPTAAALTSTTQLATTAFVQQELGTAVAAALLADGSRTGATAAAQNFGTLGIKANVIAESTAAAGITVNSLSRFTAGLNTDNIGSIGQDLSVAPTRDILLSAPRNVEINAVASLNMTGAALSWNSVTGKSGTLDAAFWVTGSVTVTDGIITAITP